MIQRLFNQFLQWLDQAFDPNPPEIAALDFDTIPKSRARSALVITAGFASYLTVRLFVVMEPSALPSYAVTLSTNYYDAGSKDFFITAATVAATLWVVFVGVLAFFRDAVPTSMTRQRFRMLGTAASLDLRLKNYWVLMNATAITVGLQTTLYFSLLSILPSTTRWIISASCVIAIVVNGISISFISSYKQRTGNRLELLNSHINARSERIRRYSERLAYRLEEEPLNMDLINRIERTGRLQTSYDKQMRLVLRYLKLINRHQRYLNAKMSARLLSTFVYLIEIALGILAALPTHEILIGLVFFLLLIGITVAGRCTFTLLAFRSEIMALGTDSYNI